MKMEDKAVSTEDLCSEPLPHNTYLEVARLEAVLNTLVENKVEAIKNEIKSPSLHSSPKALINRLRITSTSTTSSKDKEEHSGSYHSRHSRGNNRKYQRRKRSEEREKRQRGRRTGRSKQRVSSSSPESTKYSIGRCCERTPPLSDEDAQETVGFLKYETVCPVSEMCSATDASHHNSIDPSACCCRNDRNGQIKMTCDDDYISLKIDEYDDVEEDAILAEEEAIKRAKRKRRRRKRKKARRKIAMTAIPIEEHVKVIDPEELPQRARWTIVATACLLLFMCLLLVGVTLRMAPIIDDMVRKENEELMNSLNREHSTHSNQSNTSPVPV